MLSLNKEKNNFLTMFTPKFNWKSLNLNSMVWQVAYLIYVFFPLQHTYLFNYHTHIYVAKVGVVGGVLMVISGEERPSQHIEYFDQQVGITIQSISCNLQ
jgi:hypothetical protein